jgi:hypothetical protein
MSGSDITLVDTTGVSGNPDAASSGTAWEAENVDTEATGGGSRVTEPGSPDAVAIDTSAAVGGSTTVPVSTLMTGTVDTLQPGQIGAGDADQVYRAPGGPVAGSVRDTSRTDVEAAGSETNPIPTGSYMTETIDTYNIGAVGSGTGATPPVAPTGVTAQAGPRYVTVSWTAPADIADDPTLGFVILNSRGGTTFAPVNVDHMRVTNLVPAANPNLHLDGTSHNSGLYTFQVAARNKAGFGPFSAASLAVRPYNPDEADALDPGGLDPDWMDNPVYLPDGTILGGTGGTNNAPVLGAITPGAPASMTVTVNWLAPTVGDTQTSYVIRASDGTSTTATALEVSKAVVFAAAGASVTFTVQAINLIGPGAISAASAAVTVP